MNKIIQFWVIAIAMISVPGISLAQILPKPEKVSEHVYAWIGPYGGPNLQNKGFRMNLGFVVGKDAVAVLESGYYPAMAKEMIRHIQSVTSVPIKYVINSNSQPDRMLGNDVFRQHGAEIIASAPEAARMEENGNNYAMALETVMKFKPAEITLPAKPNRIIDKPLQLDLGGVTLDIQMHKAAHTPLPLIVSIPNDKVVYAGDILYSGRMLAIVPGGNIREWRETFTFLKKFADATFIPGHGKPAKLSAFEQSTYAYLTLLDQHMNKMVAEGIDMQDAIARLDQSAFSYLENYTELAGRNANRAYQEAERAAFE